VIILILALIVVSIYALTRNHFIKDAIIKQIPQEAGKYAAVEKVNLGLFFNSFSLTNFRLHETSFEDSPIILVVDEFYAEFNPLKMSSENPVIKKAKLACSFIRIEINENGGSDFEWLGIKTIPKKKSSPTPGKKKPAAKSASKHPIADKKDAQSGENFKIGINELDIFVGKIEYIDHSRGGETPMKLLLTLDFEKQYKDIKDQKELAALLRKDLVSERLGGMIPDLNL